MPAPTDGADQERSSGLLHVFVKAPDERAVGRAFSSAAVELALASYPGYFTTTPPGPASSFGVYWPALVPADRDRPGRRARRRHPDPHRPGPDRPAVRRADRRRRPIDADPGSCVAPGAAARRRWFGARSGDKGGNANVGIWARDDAGYAWLAANMTPDLVRRLLPEAADLDVDRPRAAEPAGAQLRARRLPRRGRRQLDRVRPPGQGPRRVPPSRSAGPCAELGVRRASHGPPSDRAPAGSAAQRRR